MLGPAANSAYLRNGRIDRSWRDATNNLQDLIFSTVHTMLDESGLAFDQIDAVVVAAHDLVDGRSLSSMVSSPAAGSYLREEVRLGDDAAAALAVAANRVRAGTSRNCIVAAWARASEGDPERIANALFDPFFSKSLGLTEIAVSAMRASGALRSFPGYRTDRSAAASRRTAAAPDCRGVAPPRALPLRSDELPMWTDIVAATIVTAEPTDVRIAGTGLSSDPYWVGDRELVGMTGLAQAAERAYRASGREPTELRVIELDGLTLFDEALAVEAIGAAARGDGMTALAHDIRINASGGSAAGYCAPAMGLVRTIEAAQAIRALQRTGTSALGLATGSSTVAAQTHTAIVLESC